jgi:hypothetical protein
MSHQVPTNPSTTAIPALLGMAVVVAVWILARPYHGIRHDGILYMGQVLLRQHPNALSKDLFFAFGSQDNYSLFSVLASRLYLLVGVPATQLGLLIAAVLALLASLAWALRSLPSVFDRWMALIAVAGLSHLYGGIGVFAFSESFVTARTLAEPLALAALASMVHERRLLAGALVLSAALVHPLIAFPAIVIAWLWLCIKDTRWIWGALVLFLPVTLGYMGIAPFKGLFESYGAEWFEQIQASSQHAFLLNWQLADWQIVLFDAGVLLLAARLLGQPLARLCSVILLASVLLMGVSFVGADLLHNVLLTTVQTWRVLWITHLFALALMPFVFRYLWVRGGTARLTAWAFAACLVAVNGRWDAGWALLLWAALCGLLQWRGSPVRPQLLLAASWATGVVILLLTYQIAYRAGTATALAGFVIDQSVVALIIAASPAITLPTAAWMLQGWGQGRKSQLKIVALLIPVTFFGASYWDRRSEWTRFIESSYRSEHPFSTFIPETALVYWPNELAATWLVLKRPGYISEIQSAGLIFARDTAEEYARRSRALALVKLSEQVCRLMSALDPAERSTECPVKADILEDICRMKNGPDFVILRNALTEGVVAQWRFNAVTDPRDFYLYDCAKLR